MEAVFQTAPANCQAKKSQHTTQYTQLCAVSSFHRHDNANWSKAKFVFAGCDHSSILHCGTWRQLQVSLLFSTCYRLLLVLKEVVKQPMGDSYKKEELSMLNKNLSTEVGGQSGSASES